jgi:hypothetical protein
MAEQSSAPLAQALRFRPWPQVDPVAPWLIDRLDPVQLVQLAKIELELQKQMLEAQLKATTQAIEIIGKTHGK